MTGVRLVEVTSHETGWKGTWYRTGQRHFVRQRRGWPKVYRERWEALTPGVCGGISEADCRVLRGFGPWLSCLLFALKHRPRHGGRP